MLLGRGDLHGGVAGRAERAAALVRDVAPRPLEEVRGDIAAADSWLLEARTISFVTADLNAAESELSAARAKAADRSRVVGANKLPRKHYEAPKFPASTRNRDVDGWVELEFTVLTDGTTGEIVVTNSSPPKTFDNAAITAVAQWRYEPVMRDGKPVEQRAAVRIRFTDQ